MNFMTADQFAAANKANLETLFGLTHKAFEGVEKLVELNLQVAKATLAESAENAVALVKSAVSAANNAYESVHKAAKQAAEVAESNFQAMTNTAVKATQAATKTKRAA